eukprot:6196686-Pleurochrysis_carterae.AAC.3
MGHGQDIPRDPIGCNRLAAIGVGFSTGVACRRCRVTEAARRVGGELSEAPQVAPPQCKRRCMNCAASLADMTWM